MTLMVRKGQLGPLKTLLKVFGETNEAQIRRIAFLNWTKSRPRGILWEFGLVFELQLQDKGSFLQSTIDALMFLGELDVRAVTLNELYCVQYLLCAQLQCTAQQCAMCIESLYVAHS